ncbi:MAG: hypothetical protein V3U88_02750 [Methylococcales bacterium]
MLITWPSDRIEQLEDDIHRLNKQTQKPKFKSSEMDQQIEHRDDNARNGQKNDTKRSKTQHLTIHERIIQPANLSENVCFKGYRDIIVQDLIICYQLAEYEAGEGFVIAQLPESVRSGHFGG